jgi:flagellin
MRAQIRGLNQASRNIQDGISLVQTTEGHLAESNDVLQRMRELTVQAANGTYNQQDRAQITVELDEMVKELNRIHEDAKFNTMRVLDGKSLGINGFANIDAATGNANPAELASRNPNFLETRADAVTGGLNSAAGTPANGLVVQSGANTDERMFVKIDAFNTKALGLTQGPTTLYSDNNGGAAEPAWRELSFYQASPLDLNAAMYLESAITPEPAGAGSVTIDNMFPDLANNRVSVSTGEKATETLTVLDVALNKVNKQRANIGSFQNRLEKAMQGVDNAAKTYKHQNLELEMLIWLKNS